MPATSPVPITPLPPAPSSADPGNFDSEGDALLGALPLLVAEVNAAADVTYDNALAAEGAALSSEAALEAAVALSGADMWDAATSYATGDAAISPATYQTYRRITPGGVDATDPSASALWALVGDVTEFSSPSENVDGAATGKAVDPLGIREAFNATATAAPVFAIRSFATITGSTGAIKASGNIASVTRLGAGRYRCTFVVDAPDTNYMVLCSANHNNAAAGSGDQPDICAYTNKTVSGFDFTSWATGDAGVDDLYELSVAALW